MSRNRNDRTRHQGQEGGAADGTGERRVDGTEPVNSTDISFCRESVAAAGNHHLLQRVASPKRAACNSRGDSIKVRERKKNGEGVARGVKEAM